MWKAVSAFVVAGFLALATAVVPSFIAPVAASTPEPLGKSDRLAIASPDCSQRSSWPYFDPACLRKPADAQWRAVAIRLVTTDRFSDFARQAVVNLR